MVEGLSHRYGKRSALDEASLSIGRGVTILLGPNGAGKTTLMKLVAGQLRVRRGSVHVGGAPLSRASRSQVGYLAQDPQVFGRFTCREFVTYCGWLRGLSSRQAWQRADEALREVDLIDRIDARASTLSGGMRRRLAIAAVIVAAPSVILLDEPMSGLDPEQRSEVRRTIQELGRSATVLVSTHILYDVSTLADDVCLLHQGRMAFSGPVITFLGTSPQRATAEDVERSYAAWVGSRDDLPDPR